MLVGEVGEWAFFVLVVGEGGELGPEDEATDGDGTVGIKYLFELVVFDLVA